MEPNREEQKALDASAGQKPKRFRLVKLEERIAPSKGGYPAPAITGIAKCGFPETGKCLW
jgi:hypothetical protein